MVVLLDQPYESLAIVKMRARDHVCEIERYHSITNVVGAFRHCSATP